MVCYFLCSVYSFKLCFNLRICVTLYRYPAPSITYDLIGSLFLHVPMDDASTTADVIPSDKYNKVNRTQKSRPKPTKTTAANDTQTLDAMFLNQKTSEIAAQTRKKIDIQMEEEPSLKQKMRARSQAARAAILAKMHQSQQQQ